MKFIMLTECMTQGDTRALLLPVDKIAHAQQGMDGRDTHIRMTHLNSQGKDAYYFVKESISEIAAKLGA
jgi:hypothetical protein